MLTLRLARAGTKKRPVYHLVAADQRARRDGRFVENLGYYIPAKEVLVLKQDRIDYWLSVGAQTSPTVKSLIKKAKKEGNVLPQAKPKYEAPPVEAAPAKKDEPKAEAAKADAPKDEPKAEAAAAEAAPAAEAKAEEAAPAEAKPEGEAAPEATDAEKSE
ncbi:MAG: 30S ribosomal protein S16 [Deltaproteobacteria bacterium]|jgi:small subunit ribosomal protein S16